MSGTVSREKYSTIKRKAKQWRAKALEAMNEVGELQLEVERLKEFLEKNTHNPDHNPALVKQLRTENKEIKLETEKILCRQNKKIVRLQKDLEDCEERYRDVCRAYHRQEWIEPRLRGSRASGAL